MRRNVEMLYADKNKVCLYTHWGAEGLEQELADALTHGKSRWNDESYLARVIITRLIPNNDDVTGYGISPYLTDEQYPTLHVDFKNKTVNDVSYDDFISRPEAFGAFVDNTQL